MKLGEIAQAKRKESENAINSLFDWLKEEGLTIEKGKASLDYGNGVVCLYFEEGVLVIDNVKNSDGLEEIECGQQCLPEDQVYVENPYNREKIKKTIMKMMGDYDHVKEMVKA